MPAFVPWLQSFQAFTGDYTVSSDNTVLTAPASPLEEIKTPWYDLGSGQTMARFQYSGTAGGTIRGRTSIARPPEAYLSSDYCPIQPADAEWDATFDGSLGTQPGIQGWSVVLGGGMTETFGAGYMRGQYTGAQNRFALGSTGSDDLTLIRWGAYLTLTTHLGDFSVAYEDGTNKWIVALLGADYTTHESMIEVGAGGAADYVPLIYTSYDAWYDFMLMIRRTGGTVYDQRLYYRPRGSYTRTDLTGFIDCGPVQKTASANNRLTFGNLDGSDADFRIDHIGIYSGTEWETLANPDTSMSRNKRWWQMAGWSNGTITELKAMASTTAPDTPASAAAYNVAATGVAGSGSTVAGASLYFAELYNNGSLSVDADQYSFSPDYIFTGLSNGSYKVRLYALTDDGAISGAASSSNVVLPIAGPSLGYQPRWESGELRFYKPTAGTYTLTGGYYRVYHATQSNGTYSQTTSTLYSSLTWNATDGYGEYVTASQLGLTVNSSKWYKVQVQDSYGLITDGQTATYGGDTLSATCILTITGYTTLASQTVYIWASAPFTVQGQLFDVQAITVTLDGSGDGTATLGRTAAAEALDGTGTPFYYIRMGNNTYKISIPDNDTATLDSLL